MKKKRIKKRAADRGVKLNEKSEHSCDQAAGKFTDIFLLFFVVKFESNYQFVSLLN